MIELQQVTKYYATGSKRNYILDAVSGIIPRKNIAVMGANGAGKSTLLRLLAGVERPNSGSIERNVDVSFPLGFRGSFNPQLSGAENTLFVARIYNVDTEKMLDYVENFAELGVYFRQPVREYSSGMRARLAFGVSLAIDFDLYLVDEITAVGDIRFKRKAKHAFELKLKKSNIIMVSHNVGQLRDYCDTGIVLDKGNIYGYYDIGEAISLHNSIMNRGA